MWFYLSSLVIFGVVVPVFRCIFLMSLVLHTSVVISLVTFFLSLVVYPPESYYDLSSSSSEMSSSSFISSLSLSIEIGYNVSF